MNTENEYHLGLTILLGTGEKNQSHIGVMVPTKIREAILKLSLKDRAEMRDAISGVIRNTFDNIHLGETATAMTNDISEMEIN